MEKPSIAFRHQDVNRRLAAEDPRLIVNDYQQDATIWALFIYS